MNAVSSALYLRKFILPPLAAVFVSAQAAHGASLAFDNATHSTYDDGWQTGDNGGFGFGAWQLFAEDAFVASSTANGAGDPGGDGDIDTEGRSWGMSTFIPGPISHEVSWATRPFAGALTLGQQFVIDIDVGQPATIGGYGGFALRDNGTNERFTLKITSGGAIVQDVGTTVPFTDQGFHVVFTLTGADSYSVTFYGVGVDGPPGLPITVSGSLFGPSGAGLVEVRLFALDTGPAPENFVFFNSMAIIPEPSTFALVAIGVLAALSFRRRKEGHYACANVGGGG